MLPSMARFTNPLMKHSPAQPRRALLPDILLMKTYLIPVSGQYFVLAGREALRWRLWLAVRRSEAGVGAGEEESVVRNLLHLILRSGLKLRQRVLQLFTSKPTLLRRVQVYPTWRTRGAGVARTSYYYRKTCGEICPHETCVRTRQHTVSISHTALVTGGTPLVRWAGIWGRTGQGVTAFPDERLLVALEAVLRGIASKHLSTNQRFEATRIFSHLTARSFKLSYTFSLLCLGK